MEFLAGYGSDDQGSDGPCVHTSQQNEAASTGEHGAVQDIARVTSTLNNVSQESKTSSARVIELDITQETRKDGRRGTPGMTKSNKKGFKRYDGKRKSRWTKSSAFLAPVAYDKEGLNDNEGEEEEEEEARGTGKGMKATTSGRPSLSHILPAPSKAVKDKGVGRIIQESRPNEEDQEPHIQGRHEGVESKHGLVGQQYYPQNESGKTLEYSQELRVNIAPAVQEKPMQNKWHEWTKGALQNQEMEQKVVQFKEISADELRKTGHGPASDGDALRSALGPEYEDKLRTEAAKVGGISSLAKKKHQLSSLFAQAKNQELEDLEKRSSGMRTKTETQRKYGW